MRKKEEQIATPTVTWSSDNEAVATVDSDGKVTAMGEGTANITATADGGKTATCAVTVKELAYALEDGSEPIWVKNSSTPLALHIKRSANDTLTLDKFEKVLVDEVEVDNSNYKAKSGSLLLTFTTDYLGTLSVGSHTARVVFSDDEVSVVFTVKAPPVGSASPDSDYVLQSSSGTLVYDSPDIGDGDGMMIANALLLALLAAGAAYAVRKSRKDG